MMTDQPDRSDQSAQSDGRIGRMIGHFSSFWAEITDQTFGVSFFRIYNVASENDFRTFISRKALAPVRRDTLEPGLAPCG